VKPAGISGIDRGTIGNKTLMNLEQSIRTRTSETFLEELMNLRGATNLDITQ
jgi:hypothetical protein